jgi:hypothetical protein
MDKIQVLIDNGFITLNDVLTYAYNHHALEELNEEYERNNFEPEYPDYDDDYNQMINEHEYEEQLANELNRQEYIDSAYNTEYVLASTSQLVQETMVFPSNEEGEITDYGDLACVALRYGHDDWDDAMSAVNTLNTDEYKYIHIKRIATERNGNTHNLFKRINVLDNVVI